MRYITFPFKTSRDSRAFKFILSFLAPEDQDEMIAAHNRRDPETGHLLARDHETNEQFVNKMIVNMMLLSKEQVRQRAVDLGLGDDLIV